MGYIFTIYALHSCDKPLSPQCKLLWVENNLSYTWKLSISVQDKNYGHNSLVKLIQIII